MSYSVSEGDTHTLDLARSNWETKPDIKKHTSLGLRRWGWLWICREGSLTAPMLVVGDPMVANL